MFERREKERALAPFLSPHRIEIPPLQQPCEETLRQVLGLFDRATFSPDEGVNRRPISATEFFQRLLCRWRPILRRQHYAPVSCCECRPVLCTWGGPIPRGLAVNRHALIQTKNLAKSKPRHVRPWQDMSSNSCFCELK